MSEECPRAGKLFGCRFSPRYDQVGPLKYTSVESVTNAGMEAMKARTTYVRDVCERCGRTIERQERPA